MMLQTHHTGVHVSDLDRSIAYYTELIGLELELRREVDAEYVGRLVGHPGVRVRVAMLRVPDSEHRLELVEYRGVPSVALDPQPANPGGAHLNFLVDDVLGLHAAMIAGGHRTVSDPIQHVAGPNAGRWTVYAIDPDGVRIELLGPPGA